MKLSALMTPCCDDCGETPSHSGLSGLGAVAPKPPPLPAWAPVGATYLACTSMNARAGNCLTWSCPSGWLYYSLTTSRGGPSSATDGLCFPPGVQTVPYPGAGVIGNESIEFLWGFDSQIGALLTAAANAAGLTGFDFQPAAQEAEMEYAPDGWTTGENVYDIYNAILLTTGIPQLTAQQIVSGAAYNQGAAAAAQRQAAADAAASEFGALGPYLVPILGLAAVVAAPYAISALSTLAAPASVAVVGGGEDVLTASVLASTGADVATVEAVGLGQAVGDVAAVSATAGQVAAAMQTAPVQTASIVSDVTPAAETALPASSSVTVDTSYEDLLTGTGDEASVSTPASIADAGGTGGTSTAGQIVQAMQSTPTPPSSLLTGPANPSSIDAATVSNLPGTSLNVNDLTLAGQDEVTVNAAGNLTITSAGAVAPAGAASTSLSDLLGSGKAIVSAASTVASIGSTIAKVLGVGAHPSTPTLAMPQGSVQTLPVIPLLVGGLLLVAVLRH